MVMILATTLILVEAEDGEWRSRKAVRKDLNRLSLDGAAGILALAPKSKMPFPNVGDGVERVFDVVGEQELAADNGLEVVGPLLL